MRTCFGVEYSDEPWGRGVRDRIHLIDPCLVHPRLGVTNTHSKNTAEAVKITISLIVPDVFAAGRFVDRDKQTARPNTIKRTRPDVPPFTRDLDSVIRYVLAFLLKYLRLTSYFHWRST